MNKQKEILLTQLKRSDSLDLIQKYVEEKMNILDKKEVSNEMFHLFFLVIELGKEIRISLKNETYENSENKLADIFLVLISICNRLQINLFDAITNKELVLNESHSKWI